MKMTRKHLLNEIKEQLKLAGASTGEICTELLRLEKTSIDGLSNYLTQLTEENINE